MAERTKHHAGRTTYPRSRNFGTAAVSARTQLAWIWSRESLLRLGLSLVLAVALWLYVTSKQDPTQAWDFPTPLTVTWENLRDGLTVTNNLEVVHVRVQADRNAVQVTQASFHPYVNLHGLGKGLHAVPVRVLADPGIQVTQVSPATVQIVLDTISFRRVQVRAQLYNRPPQGFNVNTISVNPATITIRGPNTQVSQVARAVVPLFLAGVKSSISGSYKPFLEDVRGATVPARLLNTEPSQVGVTISITPLSSFRTLPVVASIQGQPKAGYGVVGVTVQPSDITAYGPPGSLSNISSVLTTPVRVSKRGAGSYTQRVRIRVPKGVGTNTAFVTVHTQIKAVVGSSSIQIGLTPQNLAPGLVMQSPDGNLLVTVVGPSNAFQTAAARMRAVIDLAGLGPGVYSLQPHITAPQGLAVEGVYPAQVTVSIRPRTIG